MTGWLAVPCPGSRTAELEALLDGCQHPQERTVIVSTVADPCELDWGHSVTLAESRPLFGRWCNAAFDHVARFDPLAEVMVCGSALTCSQPGAVDWMAAQLREHGLSMVGPDFHHRGPLTTFEAGQERSPHARVSPHCFMVPLELGLRCDPQFRWWYSDDDLEQQARQLGPVGVVGGHGFRHDVHHGLDERRAAWAVTDRARFVAKWGVEPN